MAEKKRMYRINPDGDWGNCHVEEPETAIAQIGDMMKDAPDGEGYTVTVLYMTEAEIEALEEFYGF